MPASVLPKSFTNPKHPLWKLARLLTVAAILVACLAFVYAGLDKRDIITVIATLAGLGGFDWLKSSVAKGDPGE